MFGILQKMDRFSNKLMSKDETIDFIQELVDTGMIYDMHKKYQNAAIELISEEKLMCAVLRRITTARVANGIKKKKISI